MHPSGWQFQFEGLVVENLEWSCQKSRYHHHNVYNTWQYPTANQPFQHQTLELSSYLAPLWDRGLIHPSCNETLQLLQLKTPACILTNNKARVWAFEKLCRGEFPSNARVATFLSTISWCQASVHHVAGATILPSDFASGNARKCDNSTCQVCSFIQHTKDSVVLCASVQSILVGKAKLHFTRKSWHLACAPSPDLEHTYAHYSRHIILPRSWLTF